MSLKIPCKHCGERPIHEFAYGEVPVVPDEITDVDERDLDRAFMFHNTEGVQREAWFHVYGCRRWTYVHRDTVSDVIVPDPVGDES